jgi:DNA-binding MarR family transcriptional regulator
MEDEARTDTSTELSEIAHELLMSLFRFRKSGWLQKGHRLDGLSPVESMVLRTIAHHGGECGHHQSNEITPSQIGSRLQMDRSTVTGHINHLEKQGYIERKMDSLDRRVIRIHLTVQGHEAFKRTFNSTLDEFIGLVSHLGDKKSLELIQLINESTTYFTQEEPTDA